MALRPTAIRTVNPAANFAGIRVPQIESPAQAVENAINTGIGIEERQEEKALKRVLAEDTEAILEGDMQAFEELTALPGGVEAAKGIIELGKLRDDNVLANVTTNLKNNKIFNATALKENNLDLLRKKIRVEAQNRVSQGKMDDAEELIRISQLPTIEDIHGELSADLAIADAGLNAINSMQAKSKANFQKTRTFLVKGDKEDETKVVTGVFDPNTGNITTTEGIITGEILSAEGETPEEKAAREAATKGAAKRAEQEAILDTVGDIEAEKGAAKRGQAAIDVAFESGEGIPTINRALDLLELVETGGFDQARIRTKQFFGIESADEGELSNLLGKAVISQLRTVFGAAFTAQEGESLKQIEASIGNNPAANRRLLENAKRTAQRAVKRGIREAKRAGLDDDVAELEALLDARFDIEQPLPEGVTEADIEETLAANPGLTREELLKRLSE